jgi:deazaflavin-dependent oxidoreductase (nitroreductase family)
MTVTSQMAPAAIERRNLSAPTPAPRFGGVLWRIARFTNPVMLPSAGHRWNPIFAVVEHRGRRSGRPYATPVAARRIGDGFVISLAFGAHVDWYRNLVTAGGGTIRWRGVDHPVTAPERIEPAAGRAAFHPVQRWLLRIAGIDGYVRVRDAGSLRDELVPKAVTVGRSSVTALVRSAPMRPLRTNRA